ncbi:MAG: aminotransferase class IV [Bdellovibrionales bacterium]
MQWDSLPEALARLQAGAHAHWGNYLGFYSSWLGGYFREPWAMLIPMDDHGFHRGDGVFEAVRIHEGAYFDLGAHLRRLENSASMIGMKLPHTQAEITAICVELARRARPSSGILRLYVTRGPGGFSPSPSEVVGHQVYAALTRMAPPHERLYREGARALISRVAAKDELFSQIKSCNYLQNVLMKMECLQQGFDFALSVDAQGRVCEGATENLLIVTESGDVVMPRFEYTLRGTTATVVLKLAEELQQEGRVKAVYQADLKIQELRRAREMAVVGTTLGVLPVTSLDGEPIGDGNVGVLAKDLHQRLLGRMAQDQALRTVF